MIPVKSSDFLRYYPTPCTVSCEFIRVFAIVYFGVNMAESITGILDNMNIMFTSLSEYLRHYGIEIYIYKVKLYLREAKEHKQIDENCNDASLCIDFIVRIKCENEQICNALREQYLSVRT